MSKQPSEATQLKRARSEINRLKKQLHIADNMASIHRQRADKAEAEVQQWKTRFDKLLSRDRLEVSGSPGTLVI